MLIKRLELMNFGKFQDYKLELEAGINLIYGENESGKSTLHSFIDGMFYGFLKPFSKKTIYSEEHEKYSPINSNLYRGNIEFEIDGETYRIERDFKKKDENTRVYIKSTGEDITHLASDLSAGKVIQPGIYFLGLSDFVFKNTVFISQEGIYTDEKLADEVRDRLVNAATTKDENISANKAIEILEVEIKEIGTERAYTSKYGLLAEKLKLKKIGLKSLVQKRNIYNEWVEKAEDISRKRENLKVEISKEEEVLSQFKLHKRLIRYNEIIGLEKEIKELTREISTLGDFKDLDLGDYSKAEYLGYDIKKTSEQVERAKIDLEKSESEKNKIRTLSEFQLKDYDEIINDGLRVKYIQEKIGNKPLSELESIFNRDQKSIKVLKVSTALSFALYLLLSYYSLQIKNPTLLGGTQLLLLAIVFLYFKSKADRAGLKILKNTKELMEDLRGITNKYGLNSVDELLVKIEFANNKKNEDQNQRIELLKLEERLEIARANLKNLEESLSKDKNALDVILQINNQKTLENFKQSKNHKLRYDEIQRELDNSSINLSKLLEGEEIDYFKVEKDQIKDLNFDLDNFKEVKILDKVEILKRDLDNLSLDFKEAEVQIQNLEIDISKEASIREEVLELEDKIDLLDKKRKATQYAINRIKKLSTEIHRDYAPIINNKVGQMVNKITGGKYKTLKIDKDFNISIQSKENDRILSFSKLSAGTIDQIYFSLRMGLTDEIIQKKLPLLLDECFGRYDDKRLLSILQFLIKEDKKRQIILFTCHKREKKMLDLLELEYNYISLQD